MSDTFSRGYAFAADNGAAYCEALKDVSIPGYRISGLGGFSSSLSSLNIYMCMIINNTSLQIGFNYINGALLSTNYVMRAYVMYQKITK